MEQVVDQNSQSSSGDHREENESSFDQIEENMLKFLDSMDSYLVLMNSLSSTLRQGWLELASARYSMGTSRVSSALFDLKHHSAATTLQVNGQCVDSTVEQPVFKLHKWTSSDNSKNVSGQAVAEDDKLLSSPSNGSLNSSSENPDMQGKKEGNNGSLVLARDQVQKRLKSLSMFGGLFSPKLRITQLSFETALETLTEIANKRASILAAYEQVHKEMESTTKG